MISVALASLLAVAEPTPSQAISKLFARYAAAKTLTGTVSLIQSAGGNGGELRTTIQFERPGKLYIRQTLLNRNARDWVITSDGTHFSYPEPNDGFMLGKRLVESLKQPTGGMLDIRGVYAASAQSLGDRSAALDIAIGRREDLRFLTEQWATLDYLELKSAPPEGVKVIGGRWREYGEAPVSGTYQIWIGPKGDIVKYVKVENVGDGRQAERVTSTWTVNLDIDGKTDPSLFRLLR